MDALIYRKICVYEVFLIKLYFKATFRGISIKDISKTMILGIICAILFWLMQEMLKRTFYKNSTSLL